MVACVFVCVSVCVFVFVCVCVCVKEVGGHLRSYIVVTKINDFDFTNVFQKGLSQSI